MFRGPHGVHPLLGFGGAEGSDQENAAHPLKRGTQGLGILQITDDPLRPPGQRVPFFFRAGEDANPLAPVKQQANPFAADHPRSTDDQRFHNRLLSKITARAR